jgi:hypothetical protein
VGIVDDGDARSRPRITDFASNHPFVDADRGEQGSGRRTVLPGDGHR